MSAPVMFYPSRLLVSRKLGCYCVHEHPHGLMRLFPSALSLYCPRRILPKRLTQYCVHLTHQP